MARCNLQKKYSLNQKLFLGDGIKTTKNNSHQTEGRMEEEENTRVPKKKNNRKKTKGVKKKRTNNLEFHKLVILNKILVARTPKR